MFKKPEDIAPLPSGMMDAFTKSLNTQLGNYNTTQEAPAPEAPSQEAAIPEQKLEESTVSEDNTNDKSDDGEGLDKVQPKAVKKKFKDRKDKDIDNDGDTDSSDEYLHKRRKAIALAIAKKDVSEDVEDIQEIIGTHRIPSAGSDSAGIRHDSTKDKKPSDGEDHREKTGYNTLLRLRKKLNQARHAAYNANNEEEEERYEGIVDRIRVEIAKNERYYKDSTAKKASADAHAADPHKDESVNEAKEYSYTVVHAKKGKVVVTAPTSYAAAQKAAKQWKLKSTAGVDSYLMESSSVKKSESFFFEEMNPTDHVTFNKETGMYCVYDKDSKKVYESDSEEEANNYAIKNHKSLMGESVELDEALKTTHVVIDTADGNKIVSSATNEKQAKSSIVSAERPPLSIKDKKTLKVVQLKKPVSLNKDILGTTLKEEAVQLDEVRGKLNAKGEIEMTKANFAKVHKDFKTKIKGQPFAMQIDPKTGGSALFPVKFIKEEVALDEAKRVITKAMVVKLLIKRGNNPKVAKDMVEKEFDSAIKRHPDATASRIAEVISVVAEEVALDEAYQQFTDKTPNWGEDQALTYGRKKGYKEVAVMGDGKGVHGMVLFALNSEDKKFVKGANVKSGESVFRYTTKISIAGDIFPLVKVNIAKGIFYPLTQESSDGSIETAKFETRGVKLKFFRSLEGAKLESIEEAVDSADQDDVVATKGDKESAKMHIIVQLRKAADVKGNLDIVFANGKKQKVPANIIKIALDKFNSFRKPATKEKLVTAMSKSYKDMLNALKTIKEYSE